MAYVIESNRNGHFKCHSIVKAICILHNCVQQHEPVYPENDENLITEFGNKLHSHTSTAPIINS